MKIRVATTADIEGMAEVKTIGWATTYADLVPGHVLRRFTDLEAQRSEVRSIFNDSSLNNSSLNDSSLNDSSLNDSSLNDSSLNDSRGVVSVLVADVEGDVVGYVTGDTTNGFVDVLHVLPQWRSVGVGRQLLLAMAQLLAEAGCARLWLHVVVGNVRAEQFYARLGGVATSVGSADWAPGEVQETTYEWNNIHDLIALGST
jgi:GNAT superfamily N-acetyltransferase